MLPALSGMLPGSSFATAHRFAALRRAKAPATCRRERAECSRSPLSGIGVPADFDAAAFPSPRSPIPATAARVVAGGADPGLLCVAGRASLIQEEEVEDSAWREQEEEQDRLERRSASGGC